MNIFRTSILSVSAAATLILTACGQTAEPGSQTYSSSNPAIFDKGGAPNPKLGEITAVSAHDTLIACLDRGSFLARGYTEAQLGRFPDQKSGVFQSLYNAVQANNPNEPSHPWFDASIPVFHRGVSAHIDYWVKAFHGNDKAVKYYAYDNIIPGCHVRLVARNTGEAPFTAPSACGASNVIGCYTGGQEIYINTSAVYTRGLTTELPAYYQGGVNMTTVIAHEFGHFLGFGHNETEPTSIMYYMINGYQNWQVGKEIENYAHFSF